jgi:AraC-like DNA-binding protein
LLIERLATGEPSQEDVAGALKMSARSLQRRLIDEGTSYARILDDTRRGLAITYITQSRYSVGEIGYLLGFSGAPSFVRAFRRWTGVAPTAYRAARAAAEAELNQTPPKRPRARRQRLGA